MSGPGTDPRASAVGTRPPTRRNTELALLGFAVVLTLVAQSIVDLTVTGSLSTELATFGIWYTALWVVAHLVVRGALVRQTGSCWSRRLARMRWASARSLASMPLDTRLRAAWVRSVVASPVAESSR